MTFLMSALMSRWARLSCLEKVECGHPRSAVMFRNDRVRQAQRIMMARNGADNLVRLANDPTNPEPLGT